MTTRMGGVVGTLAGESKKPRKQASEKPRKQAADVATVQANFLLRPEQAKRVRVFAAQNEMKPSEVVRQALDKFFRGKG